MTRTSRKQLVLAEKMTSEQLIEQETHAGLWLDRYIQSPDRDEIESRENLFKEVVEIPLAGAYRVFYANWEAALKAYSGGEEPHYAKAKGRLVVGMGDESIVETSIALHHTYGVPYLPGSALKGLAASYAHQQLQGEWKKGGEWYKIVFGNTKEAGFITFFDALYVPPAKKEKEEAILYRDVITVHHPEYYRNNEKAEPADWDSPTPITFLSTGGTYLLALAAPDLEKKETWLQATFQILELALANVGIGGKTSSGYGRMVVSPSAFVVEQGTEAAPSEEKVVPAAPDPERSVVKSLCNEIEQFKPHSIAGQGRNIYNLWLKLEGQEGRVLVARTMIEKIGKLKPEKTVLTRDWYQAMKSFLEQAAQEE